MLSHASLRMVAAVSLLCAGCVCVPVAPLSSVRDDVCPDYSAIRQPSVDPSNFNIHEISGVWYLQATTEPTTKFCLCNVMNFTVYEDVYRYTDTCFQTLSAQEKWNNFTLTIGGKLSSDPNSPGILHEGFVIANHSVDLKPNMLFHVVRDTETGELTEMHFYACLGKVLPFTKPVFSYLYYTRDARVPASRVHSAVSRDGQVYPFDFDRLVYTAESDWKTCQVI